MLRETGDRVHIDQYKQNACRATKTISAMKLQAPPPRGRRQRVAKTFFAAIEPVYLCDPPESSQVNTAFKRHPTYLASVSM